MKRNIVLIGFMGCGKSTLARILTQKLGCPVLSTDAMIESKEGKKIEKIFKDSGEEYFRRLEHEAVLEVANKKGVIVDCGGGVVLNPKNIEALKRTGTLVFLSCDADVIYNRVKTQPKRPLLDVPEPRAMIKQLLKERQPYYQQSDLTLDTSDGDLARVALELIEKVGHE